MRVPACVLLCVFFLSLFVWCVHVAVSPALLNASPGWPSRCFRKGFVACAMDFTLLTPFAAEMANRRASTGPAPLLSARPHRSSTASLSSHRRPSAGARLPPSPAAGLEEHSTFQLVISAAPKFQRPASAKVPPAQGGWGVHTALAVVDRLRPCPLRRPPSCPASLLFMCVTALCRGLRACVPPLGSIALAMCPNGLCLCACQAGRDAPAAAFPFPLSPPANQAETPAKSQPRRDSVRKGPPRSRSPSIGRWSVESGEHARPSTAKPVLIGAPVCVSGFLWR